MKNNLEMEEYILVFQTSLLRDIGYFQGLSFETNKYLEIILNQKNYKFMKRKDVEKDPNHKQLIPYAILSYKDSIFTYKRGESSGEERLVNDFSIGVGGHISKYDEHLFRSTYEEGLYRELNEEIDMKSVYKTKLIALVNDDADNVGMVHFGVVHVFLLDRPVVKAKEKSLNDAQFINIPQLKKDINKFENWSRICINNIEKLLLQ